MMKLTALVTLMLIGMVYAARLSCDSCGRECEQACGSRRFRACCFNYLRRKRTNDVQFWTPKTEENQVGIRSAMIIEYLPEDPITSDLLIKNDGLTGSQMTN